MSKRFQRGLVVGKFCPLHLGHMSVIDAAVAACDEVYILSYTKPEFQDMPAPLRERWLRQHYRHAHILVLADGGAVQLPHNDAADSVHRQFVGWVCESLFGVQVDAVFTSEDYGDGFAAELAAYFVARGRPASTPVAHVQVDRDRLRIPTSGTSIRRDPHAARRFLSPVVYASFVKRVVIYGGESSGKTTLAGALARRLGTQWAPEYGRERWVEQGGVLEYGDMLQIAEVQCAREEQLARESQRWLICDTSPLTTLLYSLDMFGRADPELARLATRAYDVTLLCAPDFPFVQDGTRRDTDFRIAQHEWYQIRLAEMNIPYNVVSGPLPERIEQVTSLLSTLTHPQP